SLRFLVYNSLWGRSHTTFVGKLAEVLVEAGHEVVMLAPIIDAKSTDVGTDKVKRVIFVPPSPGSMLFTETAHDSASSNFWRSKSVFGTLQVKTNTYFVNDFVFSATLNEPGLFEMLEKEKFDAAFSEPMDVCGYGIFHRIGVNKVATVVSVGAFEGTFEFTGLPSFPSYVPVANTMALGFGKIVFPMLKTGQEQLLQAHFGSEFPSIIDIMSDTSLWFINAEPLIEFPRPVIHKVIDIGGISVSTGHKQLNKTWSDILDLRPQSVLLSFGTVAKSFVMPDNYKETIREVKFPDVTFIWKYEEPAHKISEGIPNLVETTWVPQNDMLYDSRLSLFITHCGQGSTTEATTAGIPLIVIPMFGDQKRNAATGVVLEKESLEKPEILEDALRTVLGNEKYRTKAREVGEMIRNRPISPRETFVRNMEFLARFGPLRMLDHYGKNLNFVEYYLIDVFAFVSFIVLCLLVVFYKSIKFIIS
ncbi:hypothetical protein PFISCL1PPCAC_14579, partial [Pristionchus fissidentatus]